MNDVEAPLSKSRAPLPQPLKFAMHTPFAGSGINVPDINLQDALWLKPSSNVTFAAGLDRRLFSTVVVPSRHIHNLLPTILSEQGWWVSRLGHVWSPWRFVKVRRTHGLTTGMPPQRWP